MNQVLAAVDLEEAFASHLASLGLPDGTVIVAVSGGPDSVALLALLEATRRTHPHELVVAHADHGMREDSHLAADLVRSLAGRFGLAYETMELRLGLDAGETAAREARYSWLESVRKKFSAGCVMTAHHADDQVETILMRVLAGSGPAGLAGMAVQRDRVIRPLLPWTRVDLTTYANARHLEVVDDPANHDHRHLRSWLRGEILPRLRARIPGIDERLLAAGKQARIHRDGWQSALKRLSSLDFRAEIDGASVAVTPLGDYDSSLGTALLVAAFREAGAVMGTDRAADLLAFAGASGSGQRMDLGRGWWAELAFGRLHFVCSASVATPGPRRELDTTGGRMTWGQWEVAWSCEPAPPGMKRQDMTTWLSPAPVTVREWTVGDRVRPLGGSGHRLVVRCFQDAVVPRRQRSAWPVFESGEEIVWVPGVVRSDSLVPPAGEEALRIDASFG